MIALTSPLGVGLLVGGSILVLRLAAVSRSHRARRSLGDRELLSRQVALPTRATELLRSGLLAAGAGAVAAALAGAGTGGPPATASADERQPRTVLVLDASNSMYATDVDPDRLTRERLVAREIVRGAPGRIGIVYFAGRGYVMSPLTTDRSAAFLYIETLDPSRVGRGGSSLGAGLQKALQLLEDSGTGGAASVVVLSDGEVTTGASGGDLSDAVDLAERLGIPVYVVGLGTKEGGTIPLAEVQGGQPGRLIRPPASTGEEDTTGGGYLRGDDGRIVVSELDEASLRRIADRTGGQYVTGEPDAGGRVARALRGRMEGSGAPPGTPSPGRGLLLAGFGLLLAEAFLFRRG